MSKEYHRCVGLELAGAKSHRSSVAVLDYYPKKERLVLQDISEGIPEEGTKSPDEILVEKLLSLRKTTQKFSGLSVHGPTSFPSYLSSPKGKKQGLGTQTQDAEAEWMFGIWKELNPQPRPFVPYLQRPAEIWLRYCTSEKFIVTDAFGANGAPLAARLRTLLPYLPKPIHESLPRATLARIVSTLHMPKWIPKSYTDLEEGIKSREEFFTQLHKKVPQLFFYHRDLETMISHLSCFHSFLSALNQFLILKDSCEKAPRSFPKKATWIPIPRSMLRWENLFK